ncbi:MAG TPA: DUF5518 domain-containing protein [Acidobacteriota bacterium]|nr:DUF5518 domain-containing protein [Acidobacteriota bacterium]
MSEKTMLKPALAGGIVAGILSAVPYINVGNCLCCAWVIGGGMLAAYLHVKDSLSPATLGRGAAVGLLTGIVGAVVFALFSIPINHLTRDAQNRFLQMLHEALNEMQNVPPETYERLESLLADGGPGFLLTGLTLVVTVFIFLLFSTIGGTIGVALFEKRKIESPQQDMVKHEP